MIEQTTLTDPRVQTLRQALAEQYVHTYGDHDLDTDDPRDYMPPHGALFIATRDGEPVGIGSYRRHDATTCESRRLYVIPSARRDGWALRLWTAYTSHAAAAGYTYAIGTTNTPAILAPLRHKIIEPYNHEGQSDGVVTFRAPILAPSPIAHLKAYGSAHGQRHVSDWRAARPQPRYHTLDAP